jgi:hypothetical protein
VVVEFSEVGLVKSPNYIWRSLSEMNGLPRNNNCYESNKAVSLWLI